ncbi:MAG: RNA 2'-phosphotransferase [Chitinophagaceae bacterium]|nr:MAG: RNA 2'-phosphotransferase [Chitinophagaceae bacterium]
MTHSEKTLKTISKFLSLVLRHDPARAGISLDENGWADVAQLIAGISSKGIALDRALLDEVVRTNAKQRFAFDESGSRIRASQGHSVTVALGYEPQEPPALLYHGTVAAALPSIRESGLEKRDRHHVHLSADTATAQAVGGRRGKPVLLEVDAAAMQAAGFLFYRSDNGVWLTDAVPPQYLRFPLQ